MLLYHRVVFVINKIVLVGLVHRDPELTGDIIPELVLISIEVILGDVGEDSYVGSERDYIVQLEAADLHYIPFLRVFRDLPGERIPDIARQRAVESAMSTDMVGHGGSRAFAVAAGDTDDPAIAFVTVGELDLADDRDIVGTDLFYDGRFFRDAGAFHDFIGIQDKGFGVVVFFERDVAFLQHPPVVVFQRAAVGDKYVIAALLRQDRRTYTAFAAAEYDQTF